jgi:hypothetical protein
MSIMPMNPVQRKKPKNDCRGLYILLQDSIYFRAMSRFLLEMSIAIAHLWNSLPGKISGVESHGRIAGAQF